LLYLIIHALNGWNLSLFFWYCCFTIRSLF
jgi:hypothetical protein